MSIAQRILKEVTQKLDTITVDEKDEENLHHINDAKTIKLFKLYQKLGNLMYNHNHEVKWEPKDYKDYEEYIDAIMDFNCEDDANCEQYKDVFIKKSTIVHRVTKEPVTPHVYNAPRMNFNAPNMSNKMIGLGGRKASKKSRKTKSKKSKKSKKTKSRRH
jgi:hypothetical protein